MSDQRSPLVSDPGPTSGTPQGLSCFAVLLIKSRRLPRRRERPGFLAG
jgi:hypothetical protein